MVIKNDAERPDNKEETEEEKDSSAETPSGEVTEKNSNSLSGVLNAKIAALALVGVVIGILIGQVALPGFGLGLVALGGGGNTGSGAVAVLSEFEVQEKVQGYLEENFAQQEIVVEITNFEEFNDEFYFVEFKLSKDGQDQIVEIYVTKNGNTLLSGQVIDLQAPIPEVQSPEQPQAVKVQKSDKPIVEVFVMSYCPYGLQMQKAVLPVMKLLGDKADIETKFVSYIMHDLPEIQENTVQYCIQKEQNEKYFDYLNCFVIKGDSGACLASAGVNIETLGNCVAAADTEFGITAAYEDTASWLSGSFPIYNVHKGLNELYGVQGSPTLVINGSVVSAGRSPEAVKQAICGAFNEAPAECSEVLSSTQVAPSFGSGTGDGSEGYC